MPPEREMPERRKDQDVLRHAAHPRAAQAAGALQTQDFRDRRRERYKIEAKNAHVKRGLGYGRAMFYGLDMMTVQCAVTMFVSNLKKIYTKIP